MAKASNIEIPSLLFEEQASAPSTPGTGFWRIYHKSDGLYLVDDAGTEFGPIKGRGWSLIDSLTVGTDGDTVEFSSIPGTYEDLRLVVMGRSMSAATRATARLRVGHGTIDTGSNYGYVTHYIGASAGTFQGSSESHIAAGMLGGEGSSSTSDGLFTLEVFRYTATGAERHVRVEGHCNLDFASHREIFNCGGMWSNTADAIDILDLDDDGGDGWTSGTRAYLYGR